MTNPVHHDPRWGSGLRLQSASSNVAPLPSMPSGRCAACIGSSVIWTNTEFGPSTKPGFSCRALHAATAACLVTCHSCVRQAHAPSRRPASPSAARSPWPARPSQVKCRAAGAVGRIAQLRGDGVHCAGTGSGLVWAGGWVKEMLEVAWSGALHMCAHLQIARWASGATFCYYIEKIVARAPESQLVSTGA